MEWQSLFFVLLQVANWSTATFEIGIRSKLSNLFVPVTNCSGQVTKTAGGSFEVYCGNSDDFSDCFWTLPQTSGTPCRLIDGIQIGDCPAALRKEGKKCVASVDSFQPSLHQGQWNCILLTFNGGINTTDPLMLQMVALREAIPALDQNALTLNENEARQVRCSSSNAVYGPQQNDRIFGWSINGDIYFNADYGLVNETKRDCTINSLRLYNELCVFDSTITYKAKEGDSYLDCFSTQTDSFGEVVISAPARVAVTVVSPNKITDLSLEAKIGIALAVIVPIVLIVIVFILAFCFGWCCFKGRRAEKQPQALEVNDEPKSGTPYVIHYEQPQIRQQPAPPPLVVKPRNYERLLMPDPYADLPSDELLIYRWEGFGRSISAATSFSSLDSLEPDRDWSDTLRSFGPKFKHLADLASGEANATSTSDEEETSAEDASSSSTFSHNAPDTWV